MNDSKNFEDIVNSMTSKELESIAKEVMGGGKSYEVVFKPKDKN